MSLLEIFVLFVIAGICGSIAQSLVGISRGGCLVSVFVGFIGAVLGTWIARKLDLPSFFNLNIGKTNFPVVWSIIGGLIFTGIISLVFPNRYK
jgi:uncharacterized membrane protein YeaQ/YmgE (transglycosylase-associated protein family)